MRKLVSLVCVVVAPLISPVDLSAGVIPTLESKSGQIGFYPISNQVSLYQNYDDTGQDRGRTLQVIAINAFRVWTDFSFEFTADFNSHFAAGLSRDHYMELSIVKPITPFVSLNVQRVISTFEPEPVNQFGVRLVF
ncbi:MAG: hypothetical protein AB1772_10460 [Candidatus Zixiibacteriota bacterium]